jgi:hypothetical protein
MRAFWALIKLPYIILRLNRYVYRVEHNLSMTLELGYRLKNLEKTVNDQFLDIVKIDERIDSISFKLINLVPEFKSKLCTFKNLLKPNPFPLNQLLHLGNSADGGYYLPYDSLSTNHYTFISVGIGSDPSFDHAASEIGDVYMFDVEADFDKKYLNNNMKLFNKNLNIYTDEKNLTLNDIIKLTHSPDQLADKRIFKVDIEGMEWKIFQNIPLEDLLFFDCLIIEFHDLKSIIDPGEFISKQSVLNKILNYFKIIYFSGNNWAPLIVCDQEILPDVCEVVLIKNDWYKSIISQGTNHLTIIQQLKRNNPSRMNLPNTFSNSY